MPKAAVIAAEMDDGTIPSEDLIQESFMFAPYCRLDRWRRRKRPGRPKPLTETVENAIRARIREAREEQAALAKKR